MSESDVYTEYVLDRRLACRQLGMNLTQRISARKIGCKIGEVYCGKQMHYHGLKILSPYFERDYIRGVATDKLPPAVMRTRTTRCSSPDS